MPWILSSLFYISLLLLLYITYDDFKNRSVSIWVFFVLGVVWMIERLLNSNTLVFLLETFFNFVIIGLLVFLLYLYTKYQLKKKLFNVFGIGDLVFFILIALRFSSLPFIVLFSFSFVFSLVLFLGIKKKLTQKTLPLAGLQAIFFNIVLFLLYFFPSIRNGTTIV